ncbi:MAG: T9SS type A sorting domain-containing protein [Ignavibacteria bacterium]|nr:T9SS type A sorting domain-containing protein [Ignavibacteria bacterium]
MVKTLFDGAKGSGNHEITFDAEGLSSGVYFYMLETEGFREIRKMTLLK